MTESCLASHVKSTNDRSIHSALRALRAGFACLGSIAPRGAERLAGDVGGGGRRALGKLRMGVQCGADGCTAQRQRVEPFEAVVDSFQSKTESGGVA